MGYRKTGWSALSLVAVLLGGSLWTSACGDSGPDSPSAPTAPAARSISASDAPVPPDQTKQPAAIAVSGLVREAPPNSGRPVAGALVEVTGADAATRSATTDASGAYSVAGVRAPFSVRVTKDGYDPLEQRVEAATADTRLELLLVECCGRGGSTRTAEHNFDDSFAQTERPLDDQTKRYTFEVGRRGRFEASLVRTGCSYNAYYSVGLQLYRDGVRVAGSTASSAYGTCSPSLSAEVEAGRYELRATGAWAWGCCPYRLTVRHPE